jgi:hypothetical protein
VDGARLSINQRDELAVVIIAAAAVAVSADFYVAAARTKFAVNVFHFAGSFVSLT